jgi:hypothetical protein
MVHGVSDKKTLPLKPPEGRLTVKTRLNEINKNFQLTKYFVFPRILILYSNSYISENIVTVYR